MNMEETELEMEEDTSKEFYISVNYYDGNIPYAAIHNERQFIPQNSEKVFKVKIPFKSTLNS